MTTRIIATLLLVTSLSLQAQTAQGSKTLAATIDVYVFPADSQAAEQQSREEVECYTWAVNNTGSDPFDLKKAMADQQQQSAEAKQEAQNAGRGSGARGAVRGAAVGALIGEIADDDASDGAKYGAAAGMLRGRRKGRQARASAASQAEQQGVAQQQATEQQIDNFKKAFSVCLEANSYMVKY